MKTTKHPLAKWLESNGMTQSEFAVISGVCRTTINKVIGGKRSRFSPMDARRIEASTGGAVSVEDCLFWSFE